jgi:2,3-bisphosphoglycerate-independent phosphoglycerate mutase
MKYCILIIDGAAGHPLPDYAGKTCLELANTPNLDALAREGQVGLTCNVPAGMEPSSAIACMSILGYNPAIYYKGRSAIEALSMGIAIGEGEMVLRCNLVAIKDGKMWDYSAGHITTPEARDLITALEKNLGDPSIQFFPGVSYRHILKLKGHLEALEAVCTPPHDIPGQTVAPNLPKGKGSGLLKDLMNRSEAVLKNHPVNIARKSRGEVPATTIWLFWPSGQVPELPSFEQLYGVSGAMISGVDLLRGIAQMAKIDVVNVAGVTDGLDNDYAAQATGALDVLKNHDLVVVHVEAPDEAGHGGSVEHKIEAIEQTDKNIIKCLRDYKSDGLRLLILPDHPTPIDIQTHTGEAVPFLLCGPGLKPNGGHRLTESEGRAAGFRVEAGYDIIKMLIER